MPDSASGLLNGQVMEAVKSDDPQAHLASDSTTTQAELIRDREADESGPPRKKARTDVAVSTGTAFTTSVRDTPKGQAPVKAEYLVKEEADLANLNRYIVDDDAAEGRGGDKTATSERDDGKGGKKRNKNRGQNKDRKFGTFGDKRGLCATRTFAPEFSPEECPHGDKCKFEHDLRTYLSEHKQADLETFGKVCPAFKLYGYCPAGFKCRFLSSHSSERELEDGRKELYLSDDADMLVPNASKETSSQTVNDIPFSMKVDLQRHKIKTPKADKFIDWTEQTKGDAEGTAEIRDNRAAYIEGSLRPSEKRKLYFGSDTPALAPLTTQGNLPYRRLCVDLGAQLTYSEMAMSLPLINGHKPEWALIRAHQSEAEPPTFGASAQNIVQGYNHTKDLKFAAQISGNKPWNVTKATEILTAYCPSLRLVDINCGCPIDLVYDHGAGSALMNYPGKLEKMLMGMNAVSGEVPITCKIRMGTKDREPTAIKLVNRLVYGSTESRKSNVDHEGRTSGVAAITLHGRSRQQRYSRSADWSYIAECAAVIKRYHEEGDEVTDTIREPDPRDQAAGGKVFFLGNGDCYSHVDYHRHLDEAGVDSVMIARGALVKPWLFEEIEKQQYLDKTATERLGYVEKFVRYGMDNWGTDEIGISTTRRFLLEWLSFAYRYVPIGILEHLPSSLQDRPPKYKGRNDMETLLASDNYKDWIKISEMYLGPAADGFKFQPKHKSNSYEYNAEG